MAGCQRGRLQLVLVGAGDEGFEVEDFDGVVEFEVFVESPFEVEVFEGPAVAAEDEVGFLVLGVGLFEGFG